MSNQNNYFCMGKSTFDNDIITMADIKNVTMKRKEKQILERRKKIMKDIYAKMMQNSFNKNNAPNNKNNINDMEIEDDNNNNNEISNKKHLINKCLNEAKDLYDKLGEEFIYQIIDDKKISFCPKCTYPVIIIDKGNFQEKKNKNDDTVTISCVNSCFQFDLSELVFNKYSMDNIMDLYSQALKNDNKCNHNDIAPITSGDDGVLFTCVTCLFEQFN